MPTWFLVPFISATGLVALFVGLRAHVTRSREGKMLAFVALLVLPVAAVGIGFSEQMDRAQTTTFCLSCHVMGDYGRTLYIDDPSYIPARHFQNNRVPRDHACYTCHTDYTMFGGVKAKAEGMEHLWVQYVRGAPKPEAIKLYNPFQNGQCLHCHLGARRFEEGSAHNKIPGLLDQVKSGQRSCVSSGCHEFVHDVASLKDQTFWKPKP